MVKNIKISMIALALLGTSAMASDSVKFNAGGQAKIYYQTVEDSGDAKLFDQESSRANIGLQLDLGADFKNGFAFGSQINYLGTLGLEKNLVGNTMQDVGNKVGSEGLSDDIYLSQIHLSKKFGNTLVKLGRQELPQSLSPLAYSEDWNVFTNTFDAGVVINSDIPNTTVVAAYVGKANYNDFGSDMATYGNLTTSVAEVDGAAYMLTVQNKSCEHATVTGTYYSLDNVAGIVDAHGLWGDVAFNNKQLPLGLNFGLQAGAILVDHNLDDTKAFGLKANMKPTSELDLTFAYTSVNDGVVAMKNTGGITTPLYTQMVVNQGGIELDSDTIMVKGAYDLKGNGTVIAQASMSSNGDFAAQKDLIEADLAYVAKVSDVDVLAAVVHQSWDAPVDAVDSQNIVRVVASYKF